MRERLTEIGLASLRGTPVELVGSELTEEVIMEAAGNFLARLDDLLAAATSAPRTGKYPVLPLETAAANYADSLAWIVGVVVHGDPGGLFNEVVVEINDARDSLLGLSPRHWDATAFWATQRAFEHVLRPGGLQGRWARASLLREERKAA